MQESRLVFEVSNSNTALPYREIPTFRSLPPAFLYTNTALKSTSFPTTTPRSAFFGAEWATTGEGLGIG